MLAFQPVQKIQLLALGNSSANARRIALVRLVASGGIALHGAASGVRLNSRIVANNPCIVLFTLFKHIVDGIGIVLNNLIALGLGGCLHERANAGRLVSGHLLLNLLLREGFPEFTALVLNLVHLLLLVRVSLF